MTGGTYCLFIGACLYVAGLAGLVLFAVNKRQRWTEVLARPGFIPWMIMLSGPAAISASTLTEPAPIVPSMLRNPSDALGLISIAFLTILFARVVSWIVLRIRTLLLERHERQLISESISAGKREILEEERVEPEVPVYRRREYEAIRTLVCEAEDDFANVGLVGTRGVGKSYLQQQILESAREKGFVAFSVSCPTEIDEREIIVNVFDRLCHGTLRRLKDEVGPLIPDLADLPELMKRRSIIERIPSIKIFAPLLTAMLAGASLITLLTAHTGLSLYAIVAGVLPASLSVALITLLMIQNYQGRFGEDPELALLRGVQNTEDPERGLKLARLYRLTRQAILDLEAEYTLTHEHSGELKPSRFLGLGARSSATLSRKPLTTPGLIDRFIEYVRIGVVPAYTRVVIAIDELDRVVQTEKIRDFLRRVKSLLTVPGVYYIMSISEDVVESFQLRSISSKGEADSAFTELVRLPPLSTMESLAFLAQSGKQIIEPLGCALAVLSAGIPRDLVRYRRRLELMGTYGHSSGAGGSVTLFLRKEASSVAADFLVHIRHAADIEAADKARVALSIQPPYRLNRLKQAVFELLDPILRVDSLRASRSSEMCAIPASDRRLKKLVIEFAIRIELICRLVDLAEKQQLNCQTAEPLRQIAEVYSHSPLEALHRLELV